MLNNLTRPVVIGEIGSNNWWSGQDLDTELKNFNNTLWYFNTLNLSYIAWEWRTGVKYSLISSNYPSFSPTSGGNVLIERFAGNS
jgi:hypothetical protein